MELAYIGSYTSPQRGGLGHGGISVYRRTSPAAQWQRIQVCSLVNPSFLAFGGGGGVLYSAHSDIGAVSAFRISPSDGTLTFINSIDIGFSNPVFLTAGNESRSLIVSGAGKDGSALLNVGLDAGGALGPHTRHGGPRGRGGAAQGSAPRYRPSSRVRPRGTLYHRGRQGP
jgi:6-phosphogluconolactonase